MLKKLRVQIVAVLMAVVALLLAAVFAGVYITTLRQIESDQNETLRDVAGVRADAGGAFSPQFVPRSRDKFIGKHVKTAVPFFTVRTGADGAPDTVFAANAEVDEDTARAAAARALAEGVSAQGVLSDLSLRYLAQANADGTATVTFISTEDGDARLRALVGTSLAVGAAGLALFFGLSLLLSRWLVRPVERAWTQQRQFVADASHELKTPLTVMLANLNILKRHADEPLGAQARWLENTQEEAARMRSLVEEMLFLARSEDARTPFALTPMSLSDAAWNAALSLEPVAFERGVTLNADIAPGLAMKGDEARVRQLVTILLDNAIKHAGAGGTVTLTLARAQDKLRLAVHNTGEPIPPDALPHVFERFYRADGARARESGGFGLGLAIGQRIVEAHHGRIRAESGEGIGTTFTVTLPKSAGRA